MTFGPQPPKDAPLGATSITCVNELTGCRSSFATLVVVSEGVFTGFPSMCKMRTCISRVSLYTPNYCAHMIFVSHEICDIREGNCYIWSVVTIYVPASPPVRKTYFTIKRFNVAVAAGEP